MRSRARAPHCKSATQRSARRRETLRELKLLVDHRDDLVDERRRGQRRLRWHLHELHPTLRVPLGTLDRTVWLDRLGRQLARREQTTQTRIARELIVRCRTLTRSIADLDRELNARTTTIAPRLLQLPGCGPVSAAKLLCEIGPINRFQSDAQLARHAGVAPLDASSGKHQRHCLDRGGNRQLHCRCTESRSRKAACTHRHALTSTVSRAKARAAAGDPLPQATAGPHRLHHAESRVSIDIGATLAQSRVELHGGWIDEDVDVVQGPFVPSGFVVPLALATAQFRLEPLGPQHNDSDYEAWSSSVEHIHMTPGWEASSWPDDRSLVDNLRDLQRHADDFENRTGFTYTVLEPATDDVIGCVYIYPDDSEQHDARVLSWVRASRPELDVQLWRAVTAWLANDWPFERVAYAERAHGA